MAIEYFQPSERQNEVYREMLKFRPENNMHKHIALYGGGRSGKTTLICWDILIRAFIAPQSTHIIVRDTNQSILHSVFKGTLNYLLNNFYPFSTMIKGMPNFDKEWKGSIEVNKKDLTIRLPNDSLIYCVGLSTDNSLERVLGMEASTLYLNECSSLKSDLLFSGKTITSRLAQKKEIDKAYQNIYGKYLNTCVYYDFNPPYRNHWTYSYFIKKKNPITGLDLDENLSKSIYVANVNPIDNPYISSNYINSIKAMGELAYKRFVLGEFQDMGDQLINTNCFQFYTDEDLIDIKFSKVFITTDYALEAKRYSDYNVFCYWGINDKKLYLLDMIRFKEIGLEANDRLEAFYIKCGHRYGVQKILIENVSSSKVFIQMNQRKFFGTVQPVSRTTNKYARLIPVLGEIENKKVFLPNENNIISGVSNIKNDIIQPILLECESFSHDDKHEHDDIVDNIIDALVFSELGASYDFNAEFMVLDY